MSIGSLSVDIVSTDFDYATDVPDYDRIGRGLENRSPEKIFLIYNNNPDEESEELENDAKETIRAKLEEETVAAEKGGIHTVGTNFYSFEESLITIFRLINKEKQEGNDVYINLSGGTKLLAIAMAFAATLNGIGQEAFYVAKKYRKDDGDFESAGLRDTTMTISQLNLFDFSTSIPTDERQIKFLHYLESVEVESIGVTDLLLKKGEIKPMNKSDNVDERKKIQQRYHRAARDLEAANLTEKNDGEYTLTSTGRTMVKLIEAKNETDS